MERHTVCIETFLEMVDFLPEAVTVFPDMQQSF